LKGSSFIDNSAYSNTKILVCCIYSSI